MSSVSGPSAPSTITRREARRIALLGAVSMLHTGYSANETIDLLSGMRPGWQILPLFTCDLLRKMDAEKETISAELISVLEHWSLERIAIVEHAILRLACTEILYWPDIPPRVTINEYLELAKIYANEQAPAFINGILDRLVHNHHKPDVQLRGPRRK
ncbi:MAG: transcription antitermination factor NusB [Candidatus Sumerlaeaceae bacterium]|nr:transcription antitermination factor NusB [Candidatus Sumerlaeaceae bacterium]